MKMLLLTSMMLISWLTFMNIFSFKQSAQSVMTLILMNMLSLLNLSHIFTKSNVFTTFETTFNFWTKTNLLINMTQPLINSTNELMTWDKTSYLFVLLTLLLTPFALLSNWNSIMIFNSKKLFLSMLLWSELLLLMAFSTSDLFIFYLAFEGLSMPMFFLIFLYGAEITKMRASLYFIMYSLISSTFMAMVIFLLYAQFKTLNIYYLQLGLLDSNFSVLSMKKPQYLINSTTLPTLSFERMSMLWICLFLSFAMKMPLIPFHMWLPEAHAEAPTSGSILLTGLILKLGGYGIYKFFLPLFGNFTYFTPFVYVLCLLGIVYVGLTCLKINHIKQIMAYSSMVHMNATCLGLFTNKLMSISGAIYSMFSHSLMSSSLFFMAGVLYNSYESYLMENFGGLSYNMPYFSLFFGFMLMANMATPITSGFMSEILILLDLSKENLFVFFFFSLNYLMGSAYSIWLLNRMIFTDVVVNYGSRVKQFTYYVDLTPLEIALLTLTSILMILMGVLPNAILLNLM